MALLNGSLPVAVVKKPSKPGQNDITVLKRDQFRDLMTSQLSSGEDLTLIQSYVRPTGKHPSLIRCVWSNHKAPRAWIVTSEVLFDGQKPDSWYLEAGLHKCIFAPRSGFACKESSKQTESLVRFAECYCGMRFDELVADFIKGDDGLVYFLQVKAFKLQKPGM